MNLRDLIDAVRDEGYSQANAEARVCQDSTTRRFPIWRIEGIGRTILLHRRCCGRLRVYGYIPHPSAFLALLRQISR